MSLGNNEVTPDESLPSNDPLTALQQLRDQLRTGDRQALARAIDTYRDRLRKQVLFRMDRRLNGRLDPDDVLQEAYLQAAQRLAHYAREPDMSPFLWLRLIVSQTIVDVHRRHLGAQKRDAGREVNVRARGPQHNTTVSLADCLLGHLTSPSEAAMRAELAAELQQALDTMGELDQEIIALRHFEELSNSEAAEVLGVAPKAASIRYVRALRRFKDVLDRLPGELRERALRP